MEFKDRLRELRLDKKLTQEELGKSFNVIKQTISSWEKGNSKPDIDAASKLADFFGVTTDYLLGRTNNPRGYVSTMSVVNPPGDHLSKLPEHARQSIEDYKRFVFEKNGIKYE